MKLSIFIKRLLRKIEVSNKKRFGLIGAIGYIAPRDIQAIIKTGNKLIAIIDSYDKIKFINE